MVRVQHSHEIIGRVELLENRKANIVNVMVRVTLSLSMHSASQKVVIGVTVIKKDGIMNCRTKNAARLCNRI